MKKRLLFAILLVAFVVSVFGISAEAASGLKVKYKGHISQTGWSKNVTKGVVGSPNDGKTLEACTISTTGNRKVGIRYRVYGKGYGWQAWKHDGKLAGTTGKSVPMEAICIELTGKKASRYDVYYRVCVKDIGWLDWAKNGEIAGSVGFSKGIEAMQISVVSKGKSVSWGG